MLRELLDIKFFLKKDISYLSLEIQNELNALLSREVHDQIVSEIKEAEFYSIIRDTTQDISKVNQLSQIFRCVTVRKDKNDNGYILRVKGFKGNITILMVYKEHLPKPLPQHNNIHVKRFC